MRILFFLLLTQFTCFAISFHRAFQWASRIRKCTAVTAAGTGLYTVGVSAETRQKHRTGFKLLLEKALCHKIQLVNHIERIAYYIRQESPIPGALEKFLATFPELELSPEYKEKLKKHKRLYSYLFKDLDFLNKPLRGQPFSLWPFSLTPSEQIDARKHLVAFSALHEAGHAAAALWQGTGVIYIQTPTFVEKNKHADSSAPALLCGSAPGTLTFSRTRAPNFLLSGAISEHLFTAIHTV